MYRQENPMASHRRTQKVIKNMHLEWLYGYIVGLIIGIWIGVSCKDLFETLWIKTNNLITDLKYKIKQYRR